MKIKAPSEVLDPLLALMHKYKTIPDDSFAYTGGNDFARTLREEGAIIEAAEVASLGATKIGDAFYADGRRVALYIPEYSEEWPRKVHILMCATLEEMFAGGRQGRYRATTHQPFSMQKADGSMIIQKLDLCKNCLKEFFKFVPYKERPNVTDYDLTKLLALTSNEIKAAQVHQSGVLSAIYVRDWETISKDYRKSVDWRCEDCEKDHRLAPQDLHTHHIDHNVRHNERSNLRALCKKCHAKNHAHM